MCINPFTESNEKAKKNQSSENDIFTQLEQQNCVLRNVS